MPAGPPRYHRRGMYGHRRGAAYGRGVSKGSVKCYAIIGAVLLVLAAIFIVIGVLCLVGVISGSVRMIGTPLVSMGGGAAMTGLILLMMSCQGAMQQAKASPAQANGHVAGQSTTNPAAYPANRGPPPPFPSGAQYPTQPPPYAWSSPAPAGGAPASSVQGPYSGSRATASPDPGKGHANPSFPPRNTKDKSLGSTAKSDVSP